MKVKSGFVLREVAGQNVVVPVGETALQFNGLITLNSSGKLLWEALQEDVTINDLVELLLSKYDVTREVALKDVNDFIKVLKDRDILEDE